MRSDEGEKPVAVSGSPSGTGKPPADEELPKPRPAGEPPAVAALRETIETKLALVAGGYGVDPQGSYVLGVESARVFIVPTWLDEKTTVARVFAVTNLAVPVTAELTSYLLAKNLEFVLGCFALDVDEGAVWFNHNLLGEHMTAEELEITLAAVAQTADRYDDEIKSRFGGRLYIEDPEQTAPPPANPGYL
jgi:hypothetical protein